MCIPFRYAKADCAYFHLQKNYLVDDRNLYGALFTNLCADLYPQVSVMLLDIHNQSIATAWLRLEAKVQPFKLKIPATLPEGMYRLVALTQNQSRMLATRDIPVFNQDRNALSKEKSAETLKVKDKSAGLKVSWLIEGTDSSKVMKLTITPDQPTDTPISLSMKVNDLAQSQIDPFPQAGGEYSATFKGNSLASHTFALEGVLQNSQGRGCGYCSVMLTIPAEEQGIFYTSTDAQGKFKFTGLSHLGTQKAFLSYQANDMSFDLQFQLKEHKHPVPSGSPNISFQTAKENLWPQIQRHRVTASLRQTPERHLIPADENPVVDIQLYPKHDYQIVFDEYKLSEDMKRTIKSIIPYVNTIKKTQVRVFSVENRKNFASAPLILLDGIPIDSEIALTIDPRTIQRVEVINKRRSLAQIGNVAEFGVLSFITKNGTDESRYPMVKKIFISGFDNIVPEPQSASDISFVRSLYWNPYLELEPGAPVVLQIQLPAYYLELLLSIVGIRDNGVYVYYQTRIAGK